MSLVKHTKLALDESRMLMLGAQILLGFQLQAPFQNAFESLTEAEKTIEIAVLCILVIVVGLIVAPSARHRIVENGEATPGINQFISRISLVVLFPFAVALALDVAIAVARIAEPATAAMVALASLSVAVSFWYGPLMITRKSQEAAMFDRIEETPTGEKIDYVLTEARVVLPGAQALLGFQLAIIFTTGFSELPLHTKVLHEIALGFIAFATVLLITPAAYHRIVYGGADAPEFYRVASRFVLAATVCLAVGLAVDMHVVIGKISNSEILAGGCAVATVVILLGLWHAWPMWRRMRAA